MKCSDEFTAFKKCVLRKKKLLEKHSNEFQALLKTCTHEETTTHREYFEGTYFDKAYTVHAEQCVVCGKFLEQTTIQHDWYG